MLDDSVIVWDVEFHGINGGLKGPAKLVLPDGLHNCVLQIVELVGVPAWPLGRGHSVWLYYAIHRLHGRVDKRRRRLRSGPGAASFPLSLHVSHPDSGVLD